jgi:uncharacterized protein
MPDLLPISLQNFLHRRQSNLYSQTEIAAFDAQVHLFQAGDCYLAFDVNSGSLHQLDDVAWYLIQAYGESRDWEDAEKITALSFPTAAVQEAGVEIRSLIDDGQILASGQEWSALTPAGNLGLKALCLNIAHSCNLACRYCFVPDQVRQEKDLMPTEIAHAALDFLLQETPYNSLAVDFFGGEPLLNFPVVRDAVAYARRRGADKQWKFTLTTNTILLDDQVLDFIRANQISLVLSSDGRPEIHDAYRVTPSGAGTSGRVEERIKHFLNTGACAEYYVRGTYTRRNLDFIEDFRHLVALGARSISLEPVVAEFDQPFALQPEDIPGLRQEYFRLARLLRQMERGGAGVAYYHFNIDLLGGPCVAKRLTGCGAGYQYMAVTPAGELYACHQLVGHKDYRMGSVKEGITRPDLRENFRNAHIYHKKSCRSCWAKFLCGGGCHAQAALLSNNLLEPHPFACALMRVRMEGALYYMALVDPPTGGGGSECQH